MKAPIFITGNQDKIDFLSQIIGVQLDHQKLEIEEIQHRSKVIAEHKARRAFERIQQPVLVEDSYLSFNALHGMPGPFIKFFLKANDSLDVLAHMLDGFTDRSASMGAVYCYFDGTKVYTFDVRIDGVVTHQPRGHQGYGWDKIFESEGHGGHTCAELSTAEMLKVYGETDGFKQLKEFLR